MILNKLREETIRRDGFTKVGATTHNLKNNGSKT